MNKKLLAMLAVAAVGVSVAGATPQTTFNQGSVALDVNASKVKVDAKTDNAKSKWNMGVGLTYGLNDKNAVQYEYQKLNAKNSNNRMHEVNFIHSFGENFAAYAGYANIGGDVFKANGGKKNNNIGQIGVIAQKDLTNKFGVYGKGALGTKHTSSWEAGVGYHVSSNLDINAGYKSINTKLGDHGSTTFKGFTAGLIYKVQ